MSARHRFLAAAVSVLLLATALRFHRLEAQSFWNDEGNSARLSERSIPAILEGTASDIHPPLYYLLLHGWRELAGETEFGLRSLSAFAGVVTVAVTMALARRLVGHSPPRPAGRKSKKEGVAGTPFRWAVNRRPDIDHAAPHAGRAPFLAAAFAGFFAAASPVLVYYSQETRMYAPLALLAAGSSWALLVWMAERGRRWAAAYVLLTAAGLYTHYFYPAVMLGQGLVALLSGWRRARGGPGTDSPASPVSRPLTTDPEAGELRRPPSGQPATGAEPWTLRRMALAARQSLNAAFPGVVRRPTAGGWTFAAWLLFAGAAVVVYLPWVPIFLRQVGGRDGGRAGMLAFAGESGRWLLLGGTVRPGEAEWALLAALVLLGLGAVAGVRWSIVSIVLIAVPLALMYVAGATDPAFLKFLLAAVPFVAVLLGSAWALPRRWLGLTGSLTVVVLVGMGLSLANLYGDARYARADYRGMAARIEADRGDPGVILVAPNQWEVFTYYHREGAPVYPLPLGRPDPALLEPELAKIAASHERLYALYWGERQRDPDQVVERWLDQNTFKVSEEWVGDVRFAVYAVAHEATVASTPSGATFAGLSGDTITLQEFAVWPTAARPGDVLRAQLVWAARAVPGRAYKVFLHVLAADGRLVAQRDSEPAGGSRPTTGWKQGERIIDNYGLLLPPDLPTGEYTLRLGLYDALDSSARLRVAGEDSLLLTTITVQE